MSSCSPCFSSRTQTGPALRPQSSGRAKGRGWLASAVHDAAGSRALTTAGCVSVTTFGTRSILAACVRRVATPGRRHSVCAVRRGRGMRIGTSSKGGNRDGLRGRARLNWISMPIKSKAQRRKFAELLLKGEISPETFEEWNRAAGSARLPERLHPKKGVKAKRKARAKRKTKPRTPRARRGRPARKHR